jgi:hypothetical protein
MRLRIRANILRVAAVMAVMLSATGAMATTYAWTGSNSGDWTDSGNWDGNNVPVDTYPGGDLELDSRVDRIVVDASGSSYPVPTSNIPTFGSGSPEGVDVPEIDLVYGTCTVSVAGNYHSAGFPWTTTVGDGDTNNGLAELNYMSPNQFNRQGSDMDFTVEEDGTMNITSGSTLDFAFGSDRCVNFTVGGTLDFSKAVQLDGYANNYFTLTAAGATVTVPLGGSFADIAAVEAEILAGGAFRKGAAVPESMTLAAYTNLNNTFTVEASTPLVVVITNTTLASSASIGTLVSEIEMYEDEIVTNGFTFSVVATNDYEAFTVADGSNLNTAVALTNTFYVITLQGTNAVGRLTNTTYRIDVTFPAVGYTNDWTGAASGDWYDPYNWAYRRLPPWLDSDRTQIGVLSGGLIRFNAVGSPNPLPTSNIPSLRHGGGYREPPIALLYGGDLTFASGSDNWGPTVHSTSTVGDDDVGNGTVTLTYSEMYRLNRHPGGTKKWIVNSDGTLEFLSSGTYDTFEPGRWAVFIINGGSVTLGGPIGGNMTNAANSYVEFKQPEGSFTAKFGVAIPDITTLTNNMGDGLTFRVDGTGLDDDIYLDVSTNAATFTLTLVDPPAAGTILIVR